MAGESWWLVLLFVSVALRISVAFETITLQPRGWPPIHCHLETNHTTWGEQRPSPIDFFMRGKGSDQLYGCRFETDDEGRKNIYAASTNGFLYLPGEWVADLNRYDGRSGKLEKNATDPPQFLCTPPNEVEPTSFLPTTVFPLRVRRNISGIDAHWQGCVFSSLRSFRPYAYVIGEILTLSFRGGSPTIVCRASFDNKYLRNTVNLHGIVNDPYWCSFVTYIDFPGIDYPRQQAVFNKMVEENWTRRLNNHPFPPYHCWPVKDNIHTPFDFELLVDGDNAHRCRFHGRCPACTKDASSTTASTTIPLHTGSFFSALMSDKRPPLKTPPDGFNSATTSDVD